MLETCIEAYTSNLGILITEVPIGREAKYVPNTCPLCFAMRTRVRMCRVIVTEKRKGRKGGNKMMMMIMREHVRQWGNDAFSHSLHHKGCLGLLANFFFFFLFKCLESSSVGVARIMNF